MDRPPLTDERLTIIRSQAEIMALTDKVEWREVADALAELQTRRETERLEKQNGHE